VFRGQAIPQATGNPHAEAAGNAAETPQVPKIRRDDSQMQSGYANLCNVASTHEEVVLT